MKKITTLLFAATLTLAACHNDSSSTVGIYENDEPQTQESKPTHEGDLNSEEHKTHTESTKPGPDTTAKMPGDQKMMKDSTEH